MTLRPPSVSAKLTKFTDVAQRVVDGMQQAHIGHILPIIAPRNAGRRTSS
jgi:hypothetical protein